MRFGLGGLAGGAEGGLDPSATRGSGTAAVDDADAEGVRTLLFMCVAPSSPFRNRHRAMGAGDPVMHDHDALG
jgi:hypothetical protein